MPGSACAFAWQTPTLTSETTRERNVAKSESCKPRKTVAPTRSWQLCPGASAACRTVGPSDHVGQSEPAERRSLHRVVSLANFHTFTRPHASKSTEMTSRAQVSDIGQLLALEGLRETEGRKAGHRFWISQSAPSP